MPSLPTVGASTDTWGQELNDFLGVAHNADGTTKYVFNVKDYGAAGDGSADDTTAIQACIDAATPGMTTGGIIFFPGGKYKITSTLVFPDQSGGGVVAGSGCFQDSPYSGGNARKGGQTILYWGGSAGGTMMEMQGCTGWVIENLTFAGQLPAGSGNQAGIGFHQKYQAGGGGLVGQFNQVTWYGIPIACQMGEVQGDDNCADVGFLSCSWWSCDTCLRVENTQGVNYRFDSASLVSCKRLVHCVNGGSVLVNMLNTSLCGGTGADEWVFLFENLVPNDSMILINGWRCEQNTKQLIKAQDLAHITLNGFEECQADQDVTMFDMDGPRLTIRDSRIASNDGTNPTFTIGYGRGGQSAGLILDNVHFDVSTFTFGNWFGLDVGDESLLQVRNSQYGATTAEFQLPDINSHLENGPVNHYGQTTTSDIRLLTLNGDTSANHHNTAKIPLNSTWLIDSYVVGQEVGGGGDVGAFHRRCVVKNVSDTISQVGATQTIGTDFNTDSWGGTDFSVDDSNNGIEVTVTGKSSTTINWKAVMYGRRADALV